VIGKPTQVLPQSTCPYISQTYLFAYNFKLFSLKKKRGKKKLYSSGKEIKRAKIRKE